MLDGKIFVIAGFNANGGNTITVDVYDPQTTPWSSAAALPIAINHNTAAIVQNRLVGGTHTVAMHRNRIHAGLVTIAIR